MRPCNAVIERTPKYFADGCRIRSALDASPLQRKGPARRALNARNWFLLFSASAVLRAALGRHVGIHVDTIVHRPHGATGLKIEQLQIILGKGPRDEASENRYLATGIVDHTLAC